MLLGHNGEIPCDSEVREYQQTQREVVEKAMQRAKFVASFNRAVTTSPMPAHPKAVQDTARYQDCLAGLPAFTASIVASFMPIDAMTNTAPQIQALCQ